MLIVLIVAALSLPISVIATSEIFGTSKINEQLGQKIPSGLVFKDETGKKISFDSLIERPTVVSLVYLNCTSICPVILGGLAESLRKLELDPRKDYQIVTMSFDEKDIPMTALEKKKNYIMAAGETFPAASWRFLTGDEENIRKFTEAVGFEYRREKDGFSHPRVLIFLSPDKRVARYLFGMNFPPFDIRMGLAEAAGVKNVLTVSELLLFSYSYDPYEKRYLFNFRKVFFTVLLSAVASLTVFVIVSKKRDLKRRSG